MVRMISKFEASGCLDDRSRSDGPSTRRNVAETVQEEMKTVAASRVHGEVSARAVARHSGIPYTNNWLALRRTLRCYPYKIHLYHELFPGNLVTRRTFALWAFQKMVEDDDWLCTMLLTDEAHFPLRGSVISDKCRIRATEYPRTVMETPLHDEKVTYGLDLTHYWAFFLRENVRFSFFNCYRDGERYADMLQNRIIPSLSNKHLLEGKFLCRKALHPVLQDA